MKKPDWKLWIKDRKECKLWLDVYINKKILKKTSEEPEQYLKKAEHNLNFANWILEKHKDTIPEFFGSETFYDWAINMYYYAIYHAALALVNKKLYTSKSHSATICFLIYHYYFSKSINLEDVALVADSLDREDIETVGFSKEIREKACYDVHESFERKLADNMRQKSVDFINKIKEVLIKQ